RVVVEVRDAHLVLDTVSSLHDVVHLACIRDARCRHYVTPADVERRLVAQEVLPVRRVVVVAVELGHLDAVPAERVPQLAEGEMRVQLRVEDVDALLRELLGAVCRAVAGHLKVRLMRWNRVGVAVDHANLHDARVVRSQIRGDDNVETAAVDLPGSLRRVVPVQLNHHVRIVAGAANRQPNLGRVEHWPFAHRDGADDLGAGLGLRRLGRVVAVALEYLLIAGRAVEEHHVVHEVLVALRDVRPEPGNVVLAIEHSLGQSLDDAPVRRHLGRHLCPVGVDVDRELVGFFGHGVIVLRHDQQAVSDLSRNRGRREVGGGRGGAREDELVRADLDGVVLGVAGGELAAEAERRVRHGLQVTVLLTVAAHLEARVDEAVPQLACLHVEEAVVGHVELAVVREAEDPPLDVGEVGGLVVEAYRLLLVVGLPGDVHPMASELHRGRAVLRGGGVREEKEEDEE
ncbi:hypothetical protein PMAYCL1PPCAC_04101, partial [Pristionchus mayeri]